MPKSKKARSKLIDLPDVEAMKRLFPKKLLAQVQGIVHRPPKKKSHT